ncbi:MAG: hypothetical protein ABR508_12085 [Candidatus Baltobacteraceae bacterium]
MTFIYLLPAWLFLVALMVLFALVACAGHVAVRRAFAGHDFREHNDVAGFVYAVIGVMYAVLLGFVVIVVWQQYNDSEERATQEVFSTEFAFIAAGALPPPAGRDIRQALRGYVDAVIESEWPAMRHGGTSRDAERELDRALASALQRVPRPAPNDAGPVVVAALRDVTQARRHRLDDNITGLPWLLWVALWIGAVVIVAFSYLFGLPDIRVQLLMTAAMAILIATLFAVIAQFDYPFRGDISVSDDRWITLRKGLPPAAATHPAQAGQR